MPAATDAHATSRDAGFLRAAQRHRRDMQHHFSAQLKGSFRGTSGAHLVPPRSGAPRSAESHRRENAIATSAKRASDKYFYKLRGPRQQRWRASSEVVTKKLGNSGRANAREHQERAECGSGGKPKRRNFLIIRVNVSGEGGRVSCRLRQLAPGLCANLRAGYIIEKMPPANRQLGRGLLDEFSPTKTDTPSENTWLRSTIPGISHATTALTGYCVVSISPARVPHCSFQITISALFAVCFLAGPR